jgi:isopentenyldiphosphate isomerase
MKESHPNLWDISSAGHMSAGESAEESAARELKEELGISFDPSELNYLFTLASSDTKQNEKYINNEFNLVYLIRKDLDINSLTLQKEEVSEVAWMPLEKLADLAKHGDPAFVEHPEEYKRLYEFITV